MPCLSPDRKPGSGFRDSGFGHSLGLRGRPRPGLERRGLLPRTPSYSLVSRIKAELGCILIHCASVSKMVYSECHYKLSGDVDARMMVTSDVPIISSDHDGGQVSVSPSVPAPQTPGARAGHILSSPGHCSQPSPGKLSTVLCQFYCRLQNKLKYVY